MNWQILGAIDWLSMLWGSDRVCCRESWKLEYIYMTQHMAMQMHGPRFKSPSVLSFCFLHIWWLFENVLPYYITVHSKKFVILKRIDFIIMWIHHGYTFIQFGSRFTDMLILWIKWERYVVCVQMSQKYHNEYVIC